MYSATMPMPPGRPYPQFFDWTPVGAVIPFAGLLDTQSGAGSKHATKTEAWGWMAADGRELKVSEYPELFAVLGNQYGGNQPDTFKIPDYRGMFLRGVTGKGSEPYTDPDESERKVPAGGSGSNSEVGSYQLDSLQTHEHIYKTVPVGATPSDPSTSAGAKATKDKLTKGGPTSSLNPPGNVKVSKHETRPRNVYVNFLIKYTNIPAWTGSWNYSPFPAYLPAP